MKSGVLAVHLAAAFDETGEKLKAILKAFPACIDVQCTMMGATPLIHAAHMGNKKGIQVLVSAGCNLLLKNDDGQTAYKRAKWAGEPASATLIKTL